MHESVSIPSEKQTVRDLLKTYLLLHGQKGSSSRVSNYNQGNCRNPFSWGEPASTPPTNRSTLRDSHHGYIDNGNNVGLGIADMI